ncbi:MAG: 3-hydroxyacyl-CoA dehydrogenase family protein [Spirochaetales bacterium]|nr:3-hydroxyacyl-CoA dehydrogenase family protein [Spirochaetales bacterium]
MAIEKIGIIGAGKMGNGIAITAALAGYNVLLKDQTIEILEKSMAAIKTQLAKMVSKNKITNDESNTALKAINVTSSYDGFEELDFVIEAAVENLEIKASIFGELDKICKNGAIFVSNTSTYSITSIAAATNHPEQVAGMHFFLPPSKLIEITRGYYTSDNTVSAVAEVGEKMGKTIIEVKKDSPGFIANRVYTPLFLEAFKVYEEGLASMEEIDKAMTSTYLPVGPFALADIIGLDVILSGLEYYEKEIGAQWKAPRCLKELVRAGRLGKKTGKGWYDYK